MDCARHTITCYHRCGVGWRPKDDIVWVVCDAASMHLWGPQVPGVLLDPLDSLPFSFSLDALSSSDSDLPKEAAVSTAIGVARASKAAGPRRKTTSAEGGHSMLEQPLTSLCGGKIIGKS